MKNFLISNFKTRCPKPQSSNNTNKIHPSVIAAQIKTEKTAPRTTKAAQTDAKMAEISSKIDAETSPAPRTAQPESKRNCSHLPKNVGDPRTMTLPCC